MTQHQVRTRNDVMMRLARIGRRLLTVADLARPFPVLAGSPLTRPQALVGHSRNRARNADLARIEDLGRGDLVKVDCAACDHVALLMPEFLRRFGLSP